MARKEKQDVKEPLDIGILRIHNTFRYLTVLPEEAIDEVMRPASPQQPQAAAEHRFRWRC
ncbi:MAG: hypothetical protein AB7T07_11845 [Steroidobacteraceae bacterium]